MRGAHGQLTSCTSCHAVAHFDDSCVHRYNARKQRGKRAAEQHFAAKHLPAAFDAWHSLCTDKLLLNEAMQLAVRRWIGSSLGSAFATWRSFVAEQNMLKDKLQRAVAIMTQVWPGSSFVVHSM